jgi:ferredoxin
MLGWLIRGLRQGRITTRYPLGPEPAPHGFRGHVQVRDSNGGTPDLVGLCPTGAISVNAEGWVALDRGRCILCGACVLAAPERFAFASRYETAARSRASLVVSDGDPFAGGPAPAPLGTVAPALKRSIHVRHIDCGSDGAEE